MIAKIAAVLTIAILAFVAIVASRSADIRVERSIAINAPAEKIFPFINDLKKFNLWNPWSKQDPEIRMTYDGPADGVGARASWTGNSKVGEGIMTITQSEPGNIVRMMLAFKKPFEGVNHAEFLFAPRGQETSITWVMTGKMHFIPRAISVFVDMQKMMGDQFDEGLLQLKSLAEANAK